MHLPLAISVARQLIAGSTLQLVLRRPARRTAGPPEVASSRFDRPRVGRKLLTRGVLGGGQLKHTDNFFVSEAGVTPRLLGGRIFHAFGALASHHDAERFRGRGKGGADLQNSTRLLL